MSVTRLATPKIRNGFSESTHICLSCRLAQAQQRLRHGTAAGTTEQSPPDREAVDVGRRRRRATGEDAGTSVRASPEWALNDRLYTPREPRQRSSAAPKRFQGRASTWLEESTSQGTNVQTSDALKGSVRAYHTSRPRRQQQAVATASLDDSGSPPFSIDPSRSGTKKPILHSGIRAQLRQWQELHGDEEAATEVQIDSEPINDDMSNPFARLPDDQAFRSMSEEKEEEQESLTSLMTTPRDEPGTNVGEARTQFLRMGDLVELMFTNSERESLVAVFIRRIGIVAQLYTMQGRWVHVMERSVQYSIPGWVDPAIVQPLLQHLPSTSDVETHLETLMETAYIQDLSVPRHVSAPLVSRMVQFHAETKEIYRRHASALDNAHQLLAHEDRLRFTNLTSMATKLLDLPAERLPLTGLFAVRQALTSAGFAFSIDRRSHRLTGHVTVRTREQVRNVDKVKRWMHEWQDDMANRATMSDKQSRKHNPPKGAEVVYSFIRKSKTIIEESRRDRQPTPHGTVGPSKTRLPITPESNSVRSITGNEFDEQDGELIKFMEAWSLSNMFQGLPRIESLPPLLLQATGMYGDYDLNSHTGMMFLQELGTVLPYENRVRFDQHLLLPQSEHSKPLQDLMQKVIGLQGRPGFVDSMRRLRHDWKDLPVYCIDDAAAHEIDDGLSIEPMMDASGKESGKWWVHIHIANPTAFFSHTHDLAKMSQHMHESVYMPERAYMMMPRWATQAHFSLAKDRPCLTFSALMDSQGNVLENKVRSGTIRNVFRLTPDETSELLDMKRDDQNPESIITVGGDPPPPRARVSRVKDITAQQVERLKMLHHLAARRQDLRKAAGGLFFDTHKPAVNVWESYRGSGLAWDRPYRHGSRRVEGDPVIQLRTRGFLNWFAPTNNAVDILVREMMLLACELAATWCSDRAIPAVFRGSVPNPDKPESERFFRDFLAPAVRDSPNGEYPMHLGLQYLQTFGVTQLSTTPFKHKILGMERYGKVTSPLRRYGDMIVHWQIEAALRHEAKTGQSLVVDPSPTTTTSETADLDRSFLPFSAPTLRNLFRIMQPRESMINKAKAYAEDYWKALALFRAFHFGEAELPCYTRHPTDPKKNTFRVYMHQNVNSVYPSPYVGVIVEELNIGGSMFRPEREGKNGGVEGMPEAKLGDVWECEIDHVNVYVRSMWLRPLRLLERVGGA